jgi:ABC-type sugar transport system, permease component
MNRLWGIILLHVTFALPMTIFLYTGFIRSIPYELEEAALIDGAGRFRLFYRILMPLLKPITATVVIVTCVNIWNDYRILQPIQQLHRLGGSGLVAGRDPDHPGVSGAAALLHSGAGIRSGKRLTAVHGRHRSLCCVQDLAL